MHCFPVSWRFPHQIRKRNLIIRFKVALPLLSSGFSDRYDDLVSSRGEATAASMLNTFLKAVKAVGGEAELDAIDKIGSVHGGKVGEDIAANVYYVAAWIRDRVERELRFSA